MKRSQMWTVMLGMLLIVYCGFLIKNAWYAVSGADSAGYVSFARWMVQGQVVKPAEELTRLGLPNDFTNVFIPYGFNRGPRPGTVAPFYPVGLPLHLALGGLIGGWEYGPFLVNPIIAGLSLILIYLVGLELGLPRRFSVTGAVLLAAHPLFLYFVLQPMSDGTSVFWALVVVWTSLRSRQRDLWGLFAGAAFGMAFLVRPSNILLLVPILFSLRLKPKVLLLFCLGGLPLAGIFFAYNTAAYGHPLKTGYTVTNHEDLLMWANLSARFRYYVYFLTMLIGPLVWLGWLSVGAFRQIYWRDRALIVSWLAAFLLFFSFYNMYHVWWYTRFVLPGIPAMILGALLTTRELIERLKPRVGQSRRVTLSWAAVIALIVVSVGFSCHYTVRRYHILAGGQEELIYPESCRWADQKLPDQSLIFSMQMSSTLKYYTDRLIARYDLMAPGQWQVLKTQVAAKGYRCYALLWFWEVGKAKEALPGKWEQIGIYRDNISLWQIEPEP